MKKSITIILLAAFTLHCWSSEISSGFQTATAAHLNTLCSRTQQVPVSNQPSKNRNNMDAIIILEDYLLLVKTNLNSSMSIQTEEDIATAEAAVEEMGNS